MRMTFGSGQIRGLPNIAGLNRELAAPLLRDTSILSDRMGSRGLSGAKTMLLPDPGLGFRAENMMPIDDGRLMCGPPPAPFPQTLCS